MPPISGLRKKSRFEFFSPFSKQSIVSVFSAERLFSFVKKDALLKFAL
ncbi:MAG: hypothetical protein RI960_74 [Pseudomonadota bacterium]